MCDYSLANVKSRAAKVGDKLTTKNFGAGTGGFAAPEDATTAVCLLPGTELAFAQDIAVGAARAQDGQPSVIGARTAIFRQVNKESPYCHHDAIECPDGQVVLLTNLCEGQEATVLQLPAQPADAAQAQAQMRVAYSG
jgi:hypothetical protein